MASSSSNKAEAPVPAGSSGMMLAGGHHGQGGQGQEDQGQIGGDTTTSGDGPKSTPDVFQLRNFVPQPNSYFIYSREHVVVFLSTY